MAICCKCKWHVIEVAFEGRYEYRRTYAEAMEGTEIIFAFIFFSYEWGVVIYISKVRRERRERISTYCRNLYNVEGTF